MAPPVETSSASFKESGPLRWHAQALPSLRQLRGEAGRVSSLGLSEAPGKAGRANCFIFFFVLIFLLLFFKFPPWKSIRSLGQELCPVFPGFLVLSCPLPHPSSLPSCSQHLLAVSALRVTVTGNTGRHGPFTEQLTSRGKRPTHHPQGPEGMKVSVVIEKMWAFLSEQL